MSNSITVINLLIVILKITKILNKKKRIIFLLNIKIIFMNNYIKIFNESLNENNNYIDKFLHKSQLNNKNSDRPKGNTERELHAILAKLSDMK